MQSVTPIAYNTHPTIKHDPIIMTFNLIHVNFEVHSLSMQEPMMKHYFPSKARVFIHLILASSN